ncbi:Com family DNA-binding transcriptional regulator [Roseospira goensis]|uniref:Com family DNA-binding transcriptional regulator n=1 Tax=Roseospira goensis TaxID=391922 RepID=UPI003CCDDB33
MRCGQCRRKLAELLEFRYGTVRIKCPRCGAVTIQRAVESPPQRAAERPADGESPCPRARERPAPRSPSCGSASTASP